MPNDPRDAAVATLRRKVRDRRTRITALLELRGAEPIRGKDGVGFVLPALGNRIISSPSSPGQVLVLAATLELVRREIEPRKPVDPPPAPVPGVQCEPAAASSV